MKSEMYVNASTSRNPPTASIQSVLRAGGRAESAQTKASTQAGRDGRAPADPLRDRRVAHSLGEPEGRDDLEDLSHREQELG